MVSYSDRVLDIERTQAGVIGSTTVLAVKEYDMGLGLWSHFSFRT